MPFAKGTSPLDYNGRRPQRLAVVDGGAPPPRANETYFATTREGPGAGDHVVAFIDFSEGSSYAVGGRTPLFIHFMSTRSDYRRRGVGKRLLEELVRLHPEHIFEFGKVMHDDAWAMKLALERRLGPGRVYGKLV